MTETQTGQAAGQSVNGKAPSVPPAPESDTGEKWLGVLVCVAGAFLLIIGIDRLSGGRWSSALAGRDDDASG